ncbi:type VII secretion protein EccE [Mycolicibacterium sphagni]|uniref:Type VII secretion protein EccE n=1 Tax=Mycolicibacterium sphagni TaxID=1786 RepID=A0ABX2K476_9MYCO|nr:type VII secretion protein EccE [Mycolicibacterium sphagni]NTY62537.1 type VII secretion protein EccE [Mycolicibacterium sphagni]
MKERTWSTRGDLLRAALPTEVVAVLGAAIAVASAAPWWAGAAAGALVGALLFMVKAARLTPWQWLTRSIGRLRRREHRIEVGEFVDVDSDGQPLGVHIDGHTVVTMVSVWGRPYIPTLLRPQGSETPNTLPLSVIAQQMQRFGLGVDVDVIAHGRRVSNDNYGQFYAQLLADRPAAGQRGTMLVIRLDTRSPDTTAGLMWRTDTAAAAAAVTRRITRALRQSGCRAEPMTATDMRQAVVDMHGGSEEDIESTFREGWKDLTHRGTHVTSYYLSAEDLTAERLDDMWAIASEHTLLALHLRRARDGIAVSATVRFTTAQPMLTPPAVILNRYTGRQWWALSALLPGTERIQGMPARPLTDDLDTAIAIGSSGVMLGKVDDALLLMPLRDPAGPTRIVIDADDDLAIRQLIRRASASGETVAVYDPRRRWAMAGASSRIWNTPDLRAQPPRPPTVVVHNGSANPYPGALVSISVGAGPRSIEPDVRITQRNGRIRIDTERFTARLDAVTFRNEQTFLN